MDRRLTIEIPEACDRAEYSLGQPSPTRLAREARAAENLARLAATLPPETLDRDLIEIVVEDRGPLDDDTIAQIEGAKAYSLDQTPAASAENAVA